MARPTEIRAVAELLMEGADSPEDLAKLVIKTLDALRAERETYTIFCFWNQGAYSYGPYSTRHQAETALADGKVPMASLATSTIVLKTWNPLHAERSLEKADAR